jgi:hypothetical protein
MTANNIMSHADRGRMTSTRQPNLMGVVAVVVLAGAVPASWNLAVLGEIPRFTFLVVYFLLGLVPLVLGYISARLRRRPHRWASIGLAVAAAITEAIALVALFSYAKDTDVVIDDYYGAFTVDQYLVPGPEDFASVVATALLFGTGAFMGQRSLERREAERHGEHSKSRSNTMDAARLGIAVVGLLFNMARFLG